MAKICIEPVMSIGFILYDLNNYINIMNYEYKVVSRSDCDVTIEILVTDNNLSFLITNPPISITTADLAFVTDPDTTLEDVKDWLTALHKYTQLDFEYKSPNRIVRYLWANSLKSITDRLHAYINKAIDSRLKSVAGRKGGLEARNKRLKSTGLNLPSDAKAQTQQTHDMAQAMSSYVKAEEQQAHGGTPATEQQTPCIVVANVQHEQDMTQAMSSNVKAENQRAHGSTPATEQQRPCYVEANVQQIFYNNNCDNNNLKNDTSSLSKEEDRFNYFKLYCHMANLLKNNNFDINDTTSNRLAYYMTSYYIQYKDVNGIISCLLTAGLKKTLRMLEKTIKQSLISWEAWRAIRVVCGYKESSDPKLPALIYDEQARQRLYSVMMKSKYDDPWAELFMVLKQLSPSAKVPQGIIYNHFVNSAQ